MTRLRLARGSARPVVRAAIGAAIAYSALGVAHAAPAAPAGVWMWDDGRAAVEFHRCAEYLCGRIVWLKPDAASKARPEVDEKNPDPALRRRPICGPDYITGLKPTPEGRWRNGRIYDPGSGSAYDLDIDTVESNQITMRGYKSVRLLGATLKLKRQTTDLPLCGGASRDDRTTAIP